MANFRGLFARNASTGLHRELVPGTLEVYPLGEDGLLEVCQHRFCHTENWKEDCGSPSQRAGTRTSWCGARRAAATR